ncbi:MAG: hypothetical protein GY772_02725, partial [bacterium]|nr:hypothetical protein [bacterium]
MSDDKDMALDDVGSSITAVRGREPSARGQGPQVRRKTQSEPGAGTGRSAGCAALCPGGGAGCAALAVPPQEGQLTRRQKDQVRDRARLERRLASRGEPVLTKPEYMLRDLMTAILKRDPGDFSATDAARVIYLAGAHASGTICGTGTYTAEEHRALQIDEWKDEDGNEKVTVTATWMQQVACVLDKAEYERIGVEGLAERMAIRLKGLQRETDEGDMKKQITEMVMKEGRARKRGHLADRTEPMELTAAHLVRLPPVKTEIDEDALADQRATEGVAEANWANAVGREEENEEADWESAVDEVMPPAGTAETSGQRQGSPDSTSSSMAVSQRQVRRPTPQVTSTPQVTPMEVDSTPPEPAPKEKARPLAGRVRLAAAPQILEEERVACARTEKEAEEEVREEKAKAKRQVSDGVGSTAPAAGCAAAGVGGGAGCAAP